MTEYLQKIIESQAVQSVLVYIAQLSPFEIRFLVVLTAVLIAILVAKWFGIRLLVVLLFVYLISYIIFYSGLVTDYTERENNYNVHMEEIQSYMPDQDQEKDN